MSLHPDYLFIFILYRYSNRWRVQQFEDSRIYKTSSFVAAHTWRQRECQLSERASLEGHAGKNWRLVNRVNATTTMWSSIASHLLRVGSRMIRVILWEALFVASKCWFLFFPKFHFPHELFKHWYQTSYICHQTKTSQGTNVCGYF